MRPIAALAAALLLLTAACGRDSQPAGSASPEEPPGVDTGEVGGRLPDASPAGDDPDEGTATPTDGAPAPGEPTATPTAGEPRAAVSAERWSSLADAPVELTEVAAAAVGGPVVVAGGLDAAGAAVDTVLFYDPTFDQWSGGPPLPAAVHHTALVSTGAEVLQIGGYGGSGFGEPTAAVNRFDPATGAWEPGEPLPEPRAAGAAAWDGSRVVYAGGVGPDGLAGDVYALDPGTRTWARIGTLAQPREHLAAASDGSGQVWFLAGRTGGLDTNLATVEVVSGRDVSVIGELPTARGGVAGFYHPSAGACAAGGEQPSSTFEDVECMDAAGTVTVLPALETARHGLGVAVTDGVVYALLGGADPRLAVSGTVEALRLD